MRWQVFVANPNKPPQIVTILRRNKDKLLSFLKEFHNDKDGKSSLMERVQDDCVYKLTLL